MRLVFRLLALAGLSFAGMVQESVAQTPQGYRLIWSDEFNYKGLPDSTKWGYDVGGNGWGNDELQFYTAKDLSNASVSNGVLKITARKQVKENCQYTSARLITKDKAEFTYGKIEIRAKLPAGRGTWPAIWMLGKNIDTATWPACGEIDIMEHVGFNKDSIFSTIHTTSYNHIMGTQKTKGTYISKPYTQFHTYGLEWTPEEMVFLLDGKAWYRIRNEHLSTREWPFDSPQFLILNIAVGGGWGGQKGIAENVFPAKMEVDYVRVFQKIKK
uniref:glycoside hydrolase family 16 protein n=1 Tax=Pedobacter schmidteae TaxID=2201271 RepID=UPI000EB35411|nr:glycoside hydrolase family 16 protein [Pedobacter schmidteae]